MKSCCQGEFPTKGAHGTSSVTTAGQDLINWLGHTIDSQLVMVAGVTM